jgi:hypothetical protein
MTHSASFIGDVLHVDAVAGFYMTATEESIAGVVWPLDLDDEPIDVQNDFVVVLYLTVESCCAHQREDKHCKKAITFLL